MVDAESLRLVRLRAENRCEYCRLPEELGDVPFHVEHIVARQHQAVMSCQTWLSLVTDAI